MLLVPTVYVIMYANSIAENIVNNAVLNKIEVKTDVTETRKWIYNHIMEKKGLLVGKKKNVNREENKNKKRMEVEKIKDKIPEKEVNDYKLKTDDVCRKWINYRCWKGRDCTFKHPILCESDIERTDYRKDPCDLSPPGMQHLPYVQSM